MKKSWLSLFTMALGLILIISNSSPTLAQETITEEFTLEEIGRYIGKTREGILLGACDNASGVAVLLELAEQLSMSDTRPSRSICFAAFDSEEMGMYGSFAFTCQEDFDESKVAAIVNIDALGRDFADVVDQSIFVLGTEQYPTLRQIISQAGTDASIKILSIGGDLAALRGDHAPFETMDIPCIFFSFIS